MLFRSHEKLAASGFDALNAFCMMLFSLLYIPCIAALSTIRRESHSTAYMLKTAGFQFAVAWVVTTLVYQCGRMIGL